MKRELNKVVDNECEHFSDELVYLSNPPQFKCKKCGVMYT